MQKGRSLKILGCLLGAGMLFVGTLAAPKEASAADVKTVTSLGQAAIYNKDKSNARDKAIADAMRKAVEQAVGAMVSSETVTENFELISDKILSKSSGYVREHKILSEKVDSGIYVVKIEAKVSAGQIDKDLKGILAVLKAKNMPRVLLMITEQNVGSSKTVAWWAGEASYSIDLSAVENTFISAWSPKGFEFVDRQALSGTLKASKALSSADPSDSDVKEFAIGAGAEVVIIGKALANDNGKIMGTQMHSLRANISVRALALDTGRILGTSIKTGAVGHIDPPTGGTKALQKVTKLASDQLLAEIMKKWGGEVAGPAKVRLLLKGVKKSKYLRELKTFLGNEVRGVQNVRQRHFKNKMAELEVEIKGTPQDLAEELEEKSSGAFEIEIDEVTANSVTATLNPKK